MKRILIIIAALSVCSLTLVLGQGNRVPPVVNITAPANNATFNAPANITVSANATDSDGTITKVDFYSNGALIGTDTTRDPTTNLYSISWNNVAASSYSLTARATDNDNRKTTSSPVNITVNGQTNTPPTVSLTSPTNGATYTAPTTVTINANASDSDGTVSKVEFFQGSTKLGEDTTAPYSYVWNNVAAGSYNLTAKATDNVGATTTSSAVNITVGGAPPPGGSGTGLRGEYYDNQDFTLLKVTRTDPTVNFDWGTGSPDPTIGADTFSVRWSGQVEARYSESYTFYTTSDDGVRLWVNNQPLINNWTDHAPTENAGTITLVAGQRYDIRMEFYEAGGGAVAKLWWSSASQAKQVIPQSQLYPAAGGSNTPPTVSISSPANGAPFTAPATITINANASDSDGTVSKVEFFQGTTKLGEDISAPYTFTWNNVAAGSYSLTAKATDNVGATTTSAAVNITVSTGGALPSPWVSSDVGSVGVTGSASYANGTFTVSGSGADIWNTADAFHYVHQPLSSNGQIVARVASLQNTDPWAKAGVMIRESLAADSRHALMVVTPGNGVSFQRRTSTGGPSEDTTVGGPIAPVWVKLERSGAMFSGYQSSDGVTWTLVGTTAVTMANSVYVGLAVTSHNNSVACRATFDNVNVSASSNTPPTVSITSPANNATFTAPASIPINATASDPDGTVSKVEFFQGATKLGEDTTSSYSFTWSNVAAGSYSLTAKATDNAGATTTSGAVNITVNTFSNNNPPFTSTITEPSTDGQVVHPADVHMEASPFSDPNPGDSHVCTDWEIWTITPSERVWVTSCIGGVERTHTHLGDGVFENSRAGRTELLYDTDHRLRARYKDSSGDPATQWSAWAERRFRTASQPAPGGAIKWSVLQPGYQVEIFATGLELPVNIAFVPNPGPQPSDAYLYVTELYGTIKVVTRDGTVSDYLKGALNYRPSGIFPGSGEQGLAGIVVDPVSGDVFASMLYDGDGIDGGPKYPKVMRYESHTNGKVANKATTILEMPGEEQGQSHQISNLSIGPDGKLYVHMGDGFDAATPQNLNSFRGKILRMNLDGSAPSDNPFYDASDGINAKDYVYAYGFRNPFGGIWRSSDNFHYSVENGPSVDRFAKIVRGRNYLWDGSDASMRNYAIYNWSPAAAPVNIAFIQPETFSGSGFPASKMGHAFVSLSGPTWATGPQGIYGKKISEFVLDADGNLVSGPAPVIEYNGTGKATVAGLAAGPDGLYFTDLYVDQNFDTAVARGANILRIKYVGTAPPGPVGTGSGLKGEYYDNQDFTLLKVTRTDPTVNFDWGVGSPDATLGPDTFSVRWVGQVQPRHSETYNFYTVSDDGVRLWVNGQLVIDNWTDHAPTENVGSITLVAGQKYDIRMEFYENGGGAVAQLLWSSVSQAKEVIPQSQLYTPPSP